MMLAVALLATTLHAQSVVLTIINNSSDQTIWPAIEGSPFSEPRPIDGSSFEESVVSKDPLPEGLALDQIFYDVSLVDGYTCGITVKPDDNACEPITCVAPPHLGIDDHQNCTVYPQSNLITDVRTGSAPIGCKSDCAVYEADEYCCRAYSFAYDDRDATFTCGLSNMTIYFDCVESAAQ
ncbi:Pathogenesis-related protein 5 [Colletotrichum fructicola Nara gc5]|uniref:Pathogenesis-related protein 5 n=1 Tax=Colletotrichum fructicola (strain Nara gc5) TaxID=1213859 RepID=A0A7J6IEX1_COLFN|nr:Pathogenesis-related protein 5 [Colletotrichum fructicola Nara gc5]